MADSCRDIFKENIYSEVTFTGVSETPLDEPDKKETEVLKIDKFTARIEELLSPEKLTTEQESALKTLLTLKKHQGHLLYTDVLSIFKTLGIQDYKLPKG